MPTIVAVQVLRGVAALAVALLHLQPELRLRGLSDAWFPPLPLEAGVDIFFVISGFVIVYASDRLFGRPGVAFPFLKRRIGRIAPLYWLTTLLVLAVLLIRPELMRTAIATPELVAASFLFIPWPRPDGNMQPIYSLGWTLNYEMFFYVLFAMALALRLPRRQTIFAVAAVLLALTVLGRLEPALPQPLAFWTSLLMLEFALGMALGLARLEGLTLPLPARLVLVAAGIGLLITIGGDGLARTDLNMLLIAAASACLVAGCGLSPGQSRAKAGEPTSGVARLAEGFGDASYAIYLLHPFAIRGTLLLMDKAGLPPLLGPAGITLAALATTCIVALLSYRFVERPLTRLARR